MFIRRRFAHRGQVTLIVRLVGPVSVPSAFLTRSVRGVLLAGWCGAILLSGAAWLLPVEVAQSWAVSRAGRDEFSQFEAFVASAATVWLVRWAATVGVLILSVCWLKRRWVVSFLVKVLIEFWQAAAPRSTRDVSSGARGVDLIRSAVSRVFIVAWLVLAVYHAGSSVQRRLWDWPVYRLHAGRTVLPNISDTNRDVIRYLESATPAGSKILILSDQKLYFLSYYLLPRRLYHPVHPDSEFVIAQPYNQRQLAAYRLEDLNPDHIERLQPDYILEYFEGSLFTQGRDLQQDAHWLNYQRQRRGPNWRPDYLVDLRRRSAEETP